MLEQFKTQYEQLRSNLQLQEEQKQQHQAMLRAQQEQYTNELQQFEHTWTETSRCLAQVKAFLIEQDSLERLLDARAMNSMQRFFL